jgi:hypothetical protein
VFGRVSVAGSGLVAQLESVLPTVQIRIDRRHHASGTVLPGGHRPLPAGLPLCGARAVGQDMAIQFSIPAFLKVAENIA